MRQGELRRARAGAQCQTQACQFFEIQVCMDQGLLLADIR